MGFLRCHAAHAETLTDRPAAKRRTIGLSFACSKCAEQRQLPHTLSTSTMNSLCRNLFFSFLVSNSMITAVAQAKDQRLDPTPCMSTLEASRVANLLIFENALREERAKSAPRQSAIAQLTKSIETARALTALEYARRHDTPDTEFLAAVDLQSLQKLAARERKMIGDLLSNNLKAYRALKGVAPDNPVELAFYGAEDLQTLCIATARVSMLTGKPVSGPDRALMAKFSTFVTTAIHAAGGTTMGLSAAQAGQQGANVDKANASATVPVSQAPQQASQRTAGENRLRTKSSSSCIFVGKPPGNSNAEVDWLGNRCDYDIGAVVVCGVGHSGKNGYARQCAAGHWGIVGPVRKHDFTWLAEDRVYRAPLYQFAWCDNGKDPTNVKVSATGITGDCPP